ncbi:hypothetical protein PSQ90_02570 [Devosia rhodophyticola]|uniref:Uncharacterized protein n=1 Tax=Devosia rhodophyticola TaxID=3026423 RepID=A0ABY7YZD0_9HYPH|nr:hypothetical protein [Devosia rhodophyticola]WDR06370.1 hypothetical protein PSQ90_02570 [Devosia rhodophyticola]
MRFPFPFALLLAAAITLILGYSGIVTFLGAHPFWAQSTSWIGAIAGAAVALVLLWFRVPRMLALGLAGVVLLAAGLAAYFGKAEFVASYAENGLAGRFWYIGWMVGLGALTSLIAVGVGRARGA